MQRSATKTKAELKNSKDTDTDNRTGKLIIKKEAFPYNSSWIFTISITKGYTCMIQINVQPEGTENIPVHIHSDVRIGGSGGGNFDSTGGVFSSIDMSEDHSFSCDIDYSNNDPTIQILFEKALTFDAIFY